MEKKISSHLETVLSGLPNATGVYLFKNTQGKIIYIGKASSLKKRVASYFRKTGIDIKTLTLSKQIADIDYIVTDTEVEALILESNLVQKHKPRFNVKLKDDKRYPYIALTLNEAFPRVIFTRNISDKKKLYFGPYTDARAARKIIQTINSIFKLKTCTRELPLKTSERPCLNYQMMRCQGACRGEMSKEDYRLIIESAAAFLDGNIEPVLDSLRKQMDVYSQTMNFEKAASIRDIIFDIQKFSESQKVYEQVGGDRDYLAVSMEEREAILLLFEFRSGALLGKKILIFENVTFATVEDIHKRFILEHYRETGIPQRIIADTVLRDKKALEEYLASIAARRIKLLLPKGGNNRGIINMMYKNLEVIKSERIAAKKNEEKKGGLLELMSLLHLEQYPGIIECFDISNTQGSDAVASMVRFSGGKPDKKNYRRYKIRGYDSPNDTGMIHEAVGRRIQYLTNEEKDLPDLIVIDGGKGQFSRAREIADTFNLDIPIISLAKQFEEIYFSLEEPPLRLPVKSPARKILTAIRDEAHRFAIGYHKTLRDKKIKKSALDDIPDIGGQKKRILLRHLKSVDMIKNASVSKLETVPGIGKKTAQKIFNFFHP